MVEFISTRFDDGGFRYFLQNVKGSKLKTALKSGIRKTLGIIKKEAVKNLKAISFKNGTKLNATEKVLFKNKYGTPYIVAPFSKGVVVKMKKDGSKGRVEIITKDTDKNWNPILKMMEASRGKRQTDGNSHTGRKQGRKAHSTGSIAHTFFTNAVKSTQTEVQRSLQENLEDAIMRAKEKFNRK